MENLNLDGEGHEETHVDDAVTHADDAKYHADQGDGCLEVGHDPNVYMTLSNSMT